MSAAQKDKYMERVNAALDDIRPHLEVDKGDIEVIDITDDHKVLIKWLGNCETCAISGMTLAGIEHTVKAKVPEITSVEAVN